MGGKKFSRRLSITRLWRLFISAATWKLLLSCILLAFFAATLLRIDHLRMVRLRDSVIAADAAIDSGDRPGQTTYKAQTGAVGVSDQDARQDIKNKLQVLRDFTASHIIFNVVDDNGAQKIIFGTGPFYLEHSYVRDAKTALAAAKQKLDQDATTNPNGNIYQKAATVCDALSRRNGWGFNASYVACFRDELAKYPSSTAVASQVTAELPSTELYRLDFASPIWFPCFSGLVILVAIFIFIFSLLRSLFYLALKLAIK